MVVYKLTSKSTGKVYIGSTKYDAYTRFWNYDWGHIHAMRSGRAGKLYEDMRRYGPDDFIIEVIEEVQDIALLSSTELHYIEYYWDKLGGDMMYNNQRGISSFYKGYKVTDSHRANIVKSHLGLVPSEESRRAKMNHYELDGKLFVGVDKLQEYLKTLGIDVTYNVIYNVVKKNYISKKNRVNYPKLLEIKLVKCNGK